MDAYVNSTCLCYIFTVYRYRDYKNSWNWLYVYVMKYTISSASIVMLKYSHCDLHEQSTYQIYIDIFFICFIVLFLSLLNKIFAIFASGNLCYILRKNLT